MSLVRQSLSVAIVALLLVSEAANAGERTIKFVNTESQNVNDLHVELEHKGDILNYSPWSGYDGISGETGPYNFFGATVNRWNGGPVTPEHEAKVTVRNDIVTVLVKEWWWTFGGVAGTPGEMVGEVKYNSDTAAMTFDGLPALGDGSILVRVNDLDNVFTTTAGHSPAESSAAFGDFLNGIVDGSFDLVHTGRVSSTSVEFLGNVLGAPELALSAQVLVPDSRQGFDLRVVPEPGSLVLLALGGLAALRRRA